MSVEPTSAERWRLADATAALRRRARRRRRTKLTGSRDLVAGLTFFAIIVVARRVAVIVLTGTDWGRERVRRYRARTRSTADSRPRDASDVVGQLLTGMTVHNFAITDSAGKPFIAVESFSGELLDYVAAAQAHLDRGRGDSCAARRARSSAEREMELAADLSARHDAEAAVAADRVGRLAALHQCDGRRRPAHRAHAMASERARSSAAARDSAIREALGGEVATDGPAGARRISERPCSSTRSRRRSRCCGCPSPGIEESPARGVVAVDERVSVPSARRRSCGTSRVSFPFNNDSIWWKGAYAALPQLEGDGRRRVRVRSGDMTSRRCTAIRRTSPTCGGSIRDCRRRAAGKLDLKLSGRGALQDYGSRTPTSRSARRTRRATFGITLADTITIHDTNVRFSGVDTRTLEQLHSKFSIAAARRARRDARR